MSLRHKFDNKDDSKLSKQRLAFVSFANFILVFISVAFYITGSKVTVIWLQDVTFVCLCSRVSYKIMLWSLS